MQRDGWIAGRGLRVALPHADGGLALGNAFRRRVVGFVRQGAQQLTGVEFALVLLIWIQMPMLDLSKLLLINEAFGGDLGLSYAHCWPKLWKEDGIIRSEVVDC